MSKMKILIIFVIFCMIAVIITFSVYFSIKVNYNDITTNFEYFTYRNGDTGTSRTFVTKRFFTYGNMVKATNITFKNTINPLDIYILDGSPVLDFGRKCIKFTGNKIHCGNKWYNASADVEIILREYYNINPN